MSKPIKTRRFKTEVTKGTQAMKQPRRCIVCAVTKEASLFSKQATYVCEACIEKPSKKGVKRDDYQG